MPSGKQDEIDNKIQHALTNRIDRICLVLECCSDNKNYLACLRTCDILGVQNVLIVEEPLPASQKTKQGCIVGTTRPKDRSYPTISQEKRLPVEQGRKKGRIARASTQWLDVQQFHNSTEAIQQLKADGWEIWATDLNPGAVSLAQSGLQLPPLLAIVLGNEARGVSDELRAAADRCVYLPMYGFTESLNVSVATALVLQTLIANNPAVRGDLVGPGRAEQLEAKWRAAAAKAHDNRAGAIQQRQHHGQQQRPQQGQLESLGQKHAGLAGLSIQE